MYTTREGEVSEMGDPDWLTAFKNFVNENNTSLAYAQNQQYDSVDNNYNYDYSNHQEYYQQNNYYEQQTSTEYQEPPQAEPERISRQASVQESLPSSRKASVSQENSVAPPPIPTFNPSMASATNPLSAPTSLPPMEPTPSHSEESTPQHSAPPQFYNNNNFNAGLPNSQPPPVMNNLQRKPSIDTSKPQEQKMATPAKKAEKKAAPAASGPGMFGRLLGKFIKPPNQMHLPDDKDGGIVWDEEKKKWVDKNADPEEESASSAPPPSDAELSRNNSTADFNSTGAPPAMPSMNSGPTLAPPPGMNKFAGGLTKKRGGLAGRVDVFKASQSVPAGLSDAANAPPQMAPLAPMVPNMMIPAPADNGQSGPENAAPAASDPSAAPPTFFNPNQFAAT